ncbi:NAD(P)H-quinone oxidoreductase [Terasakiispira papahanaumokuakeensis]|uniref:NAD(P)H-quinone oxidoreductase n=1 Tax=Terasakiispira papahanaumokuakeensis TaxID=197479 RepID=A0A1E2V5V3_9GAMM|nr:NAD(P)H-quinone oxidoreductase [Terasakiispira papahanaumokuakeensis]
MSAMQAIVIDDQQQLQWQSVPAPERPGPGEVRIQVVASAVNRADLMQRKGVYPPPPGASEILGLECSGLIDAVGEGVTQWQVGDRVCALLSGGGYAEQVVCPEGHVLPVPEEVDLIDAAGLPEVFATAWLNIWQEAAAQPGESVLLHAGASGVGTAALQLCRYMGNPTFVTAGSADKIRLCQTYGAEGGHDRHEGRFTEAVKAWRPAGVDIILDPVGGDYFPQNLEVLAQDGRLVMIAILGGRQAEIDMGRLVFKRLRLVGSTLRSRSDADKTALISDLRQRAWPGLSHGDLMPVIHQRYPIAAADQAHQALAENDTVGKIILTVADSTDT